MSDEPKRRRGRPAKYSSDAERASAWRGRQRQLLAEAQAKAAEAQAAPRAVEKIVEIRSVKKETPKHATQRKAPKGPKAEVIGVMLRERQVGPDRAKTLRTKAAATATFARELLLALGPEKALLSAEPGAIRWQELEGLPSDSPERLFLAQMEQFFTRLNQDLEVVQRNAKRHVEEQKLVRAEKEERELRDLAVATLGPAPTLEAARRMASDLLHFCNAIGEEWLKNRYHTDGALLPALFHDFERSLKSDSVAAVARAIAKVRSEMYNRRGETWVDDFGRYKGQRWVRASWEDFETWRAEQQAS